MRLEPELTRAVLFEPVFGVVLGLIGEVEVRVRVGREEAEDGLLLDVATEFLGHIAQAVGALDYGPESGGRVGYIKISGFSSASADDLRSMLSELIEDGHLDIVARRGHARALEYAEDHRVGDLHVGRAEAEQLLREIG